MWCAQWVADEPVMRDGRDTALAHQLTSAEALRSSITFQQPRRATPTAGHIDDPGHEAGRPGGPGGRKRGLIHPDRLDIV
jgi:hypothetical protein